MKTKRKQNRWENELIIMFDSPMQKRVLQKQKVERTETKKEILSFIVVLFIVGFEIFLFFAW